MSDTDTTTTDAPVVDKNAKVQAEVRCAGVTYYDRVPVMDPWGEISKDPNGNDIYALDRSMASMGQIIEISPYEFQRLAKEDAVQVPGSAPLPGAPGQSAMATPFTTPIPPEGGEVQPWTAPVMGDPRPSGQATDGEYVQNVGPGSALSADELIALQAKADGQGDPSRTAPDLNEDQQGHYDSWMELDKPDLEAEVKTRELEAPRADGRTDLDPRKEDLARALAIADAEEDEE